MSIGRDINNMSEQVIPVCPQCGGEMAERKGAYGQFYGCKGYPQCKGTLQVGEQPKEKPDEETTRMIPEKKPAGQLILDSLKRIEQKVDRIARAVIDGEDLK